MEGGKAGRREGGRKGGSRTRAVSRSCSTELWVCSTTTRSNQRSGKKSHAWYSRIAPPSAISASSSSHSCRERRGQEESQGSVTQSSAPTTQLCHWLGYFKPAFLHGKFSTLARKRGAGRETLQLAGGIAWYLVLLPEGEALVPKPHPEKQNLTFTLRPLPMPNQRRYLVLVEDEDLVTGFTLETSTQSPTLRPVPEPRVAPCPR